ncbi:hypothetical protein C8J57DRAFT_1566652 [Mycena rebaudengoi]|nr:hypothetical protein C8J57DRAFT_1566652 [Mycena rebaudengoi]
MASDADPAPSASSLITPPLDPQKIASGPLCPYLRIWTFYWACGVVLDTLRQSLKLGNYKGTAEKGAIPTAEVKQHCQKVRLELPTSNRKPSDPIVAGIPTLHDLLNPDTVDDEPIDEEALFNNPDPYGIKDCEAEEDEEEESDIAAPSLVFRRADVLTLEIEAYIDLSCLKLTQRFAPDH